MEIRKARPEEMDAVYLMGEDVWAEGSPRDEYLAGCRASPKYARGTWYVLADGPTLLSSLLLHTFGEGAYGLGSIATPAPARGQGFASRLVRGVMGELEAARESCTIFLYSDIDVRFYERFGFAALPPEEQHHPGSVLMAKKKGDGPTPAAPMYF